MHNAAASVSFIRLLQNLMRAPNAQGRARAMQSVNYRDGHDTSNAKQASGRKPSNEAVGAPYATISKHEARQQQLALTSLRKMQTIFPTAIVGDAKSKQQHRSEDCHRRNEHRDKDGLATQTDEPIPLESTTDVQPNAANKYRRDPKIAPCTRQRIAIPLMSSILGFLLAQR